MHNPIENRSTKTCTVTKNILFNNSHDLGFTNQDIRSSTLAVISNTLRYLKNPTEPAQQSLQQLFKKWQHTVDIEISNTQIAKSLKLSMQQWLELNINKDDNPIQRNTRAKRHFNHINTSIAVLNLNHQDKPICILHYLMIHPINQLSNELMQMQANVFHLVANHHYQLQQKPSYAKIAKRLFVSEEKHNQHAHMTYLMIGMTFGIILAKLVPYSLVGACTA